LVSDERTYTGQDSHNIHRVGTDDDVVVVAMASVFAAAVGGGCTGTSSPDTVSRICKVGRTSNDAKLLCRQGDASTGNTFCWYTVDRTYTDGRVFVDFLTNRIPRPMAVVCSVGGTMPTVVVVVVIVYCASPRGGDGHGDGHGDRILRRRVGGSCGCCGPCGC
jgi:hypothetical protein